MAQTLASGGNLFAIGGLSYLFKDLFLKYIRYLMVLMVRRLNEEPLYFPALVCLTTHTITFQRHNLLQIIMKLGILKYHAKLQTNITEFTNNLLLHLRVNNVK